jgi:hypothetical protein
VLGLQVDEDDARGHEGWQQQPAASCDSVSEHIHHDSGRSRCTAETPSDLKYPHRSRGRDTVHVSSGGNRRAMLTRTSQKQQWHFGSNISQLEEGLGGQSCGIE